MKKFFTFICFLFVTICSFAQLNVVGEFNDNKKICTIRTSYSYLYQTKDGYEFVSKTTNRYDNRFYLFLGEDIESAIQTSQDLIDLLDNEEFENAIITNKDENCTIGKVKMLGQPYYLLTDSKHAGSCNLTKGELKKIIDKLQSINNK